MSRKVIVTGSFDPITRGHVYVIEQALKMADEVLVWIAVNKSKAGMFSFDERATLIHQSVKEILGNGAHVKIEAIASDKFVAREARKAGAYAILRGIRNTIDFEYEKDQQQFNAEIEPMITTMFVMPPAELTRVSSSALKSIVGIEGWEREAYEYLPAVVVEALNMRVA